MKKLIISILFVLYLSFPVQAMILAGINTGGLPVPGAPGSVTATAGDTLITMTWTPATNAASYNIGCATSTGTETYTTFTGVTSPSNVTSLTNGTPYFCNVQAVNAAGTQVGTEATATPTAPAGPTALAAQNTADQQTSLTWTASGSPDSYNLYWVAGSSFSGACTSGGTKITGVTSGYAKTGLTDNTQYAYAVTEVKSGAESACSSTVTSTAKAPATFGDTSIESGTTTFAAGYTQSGDVVTTPSDAGNAPLISCTLYAQSLYGNVEKFKSQIWNSSGIMFTNGYGGEVSFSSSSWGWYTSTFTIPPILSASQSVWIGWVQSAVDTQFNIKYVVSGTNKYAANIASSYYTTPTSFATPSTETATFSFYCTYIPQSL